MKLIADSGSSKADWVCIPSNQEAYRFKSRGINPFHRTYQEVRQILNEDFPQEFQFENVREVYFYGAGCANASMCLELERTFSDQFPHANIEVASDLLGAARGFWGRNSGVICVLGTGASCCAYNGQIITQQSISLGYIMGDEGGGADIGKRLLRKFFYGELSEELAEDLRNHGLNRDEFLRQVYRSERPAAYLADFVLYLSKRKETPEVQLIVKEAFQEYIDHHIRVVIQPGMHVGFVGSVAFLFQEILEEQMRENELPYAGIVRYPIEALSVFHQS